MSGTAAPALGAERASTSRALPMLLCAALGGRLVAWALLTAADPARLLSPDSASYLDSARALLHGAFAISPAPGSPPQTVRTPGYPLFAAAVFALFGERPAAVVAAQLVVSVVTIAVAFAIARTLWDARAAFVAAALLAVDLGSFCLAEVVLSETLFTCVVAASLLVVVRAVSSGRASPSAAALAGALCTAAAFVRPVAYYLAPLLAIGAFAWARRAGGSGSSAPALAALVLVPFVAAAGAWQLRGWRLTGSAQFSHIQGTVLLFYRGAAVIALRDGVPFEEARARLGYGSYPELHPETRDWTVAQLDARWRDEGTAILRAHPFLYARVWLAGVLSTALSTGRGTALHLMGDPSPPPAGTHGAAVASALLRAFGVLQLAVLYAGALRGVRAALSDRPLAPHLLLGGVALYLVALTAGPTADVRARVPIAPILAVYAGRGLRRDAV